MKETVLHSSNTNIALWALKYVQQKGNQKYTDLKPCLAPYTIPIIAMISLKTPLTRSRNDGPYTMETIAILKERLEPEMGY